MTTSRAEIDAADRALLQALRRDRVLNDRRQTARALRLVERGYLTAATDGPDRYELTTLGRWEAV